VEFVLVRPSRAVNVAAACRALKNMGFSELRMVGSLAELRQPEVRAAAHGAWDVLDGVREYLDVAAALADCQLAFGASGKAPEAEWSASGDARRELVWSPRQLARFAARQSEGTRLAVVFGPEQRGLSHDELGLCQHTVRIPSDPAHTSLNLAQAVLVIAYELSVEARAGTGPAPEPQRPWSEREALEGLLAQWREALTGIGYFEGAAPLRLLAELRRFLTRAQPSPRELSLLRGLARQVAWAGRVAHSRRDVR